MNTPTIACHSLVAIDITNADAKLMSALLTFLSESNIDPQRTTRPGDGPVFTAYFLPSDAPRVKAFLYKFGVTDATPMDYRRDT